MSIGILIYIAIHQDKRVLLISPRYDQTMIIRNYIADFIPRSRELSSKVELGLSGLERLRKEVSRRRITFTNGCELMTMSAEGEASRLMGFGGDLIVLDEDCRIPHETYRKYIGRMLGDRPDSRLVEIGNPWDRLNQMYEHWLDPDYHTIHIGYEVGIAEGRYSSAFIEEQRRELTPFEFEILYKAEFPEEAEDSLIHWQWLKEAMDKEIVFDKGDMPVTKIAGLDVAEGGTDLTVLITGRRQGNIYAIDDITYWDKFDTMATAGKVAKQLEKGCMVHVDATGTGKGVADRLTELGCRVIQVKVGSSPTREPDRFISQKAQFYWRLRRLFEDRQISIPTHQRLRKELLQMRYDKTSSEKARIGVAGKTKIIDPTKSPDFADALMLLCSVPKHAIIDWGD